MHAFRAAGSAASGEELPDHICAVLEFAAAEPVAGTALLVEHRIGIALLHRALAGAGSPYAEVVAAVLATLPQDAAGGTEADRIARAGPPVEAVGLDGSLPAFVPADRLLAAATRLVRGYRWLHRMAVQNLGAPWSFRPCSGWDDEPVALLQEPRQQYLETGATSLLSVVSCSE